MKESEILKRAGDFIADALRKELSNQGHHLTGALERSIVTRQVLTSGGAMVEGVALNYAGILEAGTTPDRIPFQRGSGAKSSKFITALTQYWKLRGLSDKEAKSAAFATAIKQKREGMPTMASRRFAQGGVRQHFIEITEINLKNAIDKIVEPGLSEIIDKKFNLTKSETV